MSRLFPIDDPELPAEPELEFSAPIGGRAAPDTWTVRSFAARVSELISDAFEHQIWIEGEIQNLSRSQAGHVYFSLVEPGDDRGTAVVGVTLFAHQKPYVNRVLRQAGSLVRMDDGVRIRVKGTVEFYGRKGEVRVRMMSIDPVFTLGDLAAQRELVLRRLRGEGLLALNGTRSMPLLPLRIGIITSRGSAAHHDVMAELSSSGIGFDLVSIDARVQGTDAVSTVCAAIRTAGASRLDIVLLVRGGGARTDLACFDDESVARAIASCPVPVFTGVGHEIDTTVVDEVAHTAHKTPTAAAAAVVELANAAVVGIDRRADELSDRVTRALRASDARLKTTAASVGRAVRADLSHAGERLATRRHQLEHRSLTALARTGQRIDSGQRLLTSATTSTLVDAERHLLTAGAAVRANDPRRALARGYTISRTADGTIVRRPDAVAAGAHLVTETSGGFISSVVESTETLAPTEPSPPLATDSESAER